MNFQQLRFIQETIRHNYNLTDTARSLYTSQPGISKSIIEFENEVGVRVFERYGKRIKGLTKQGKELVKIIDTILHELDQLKKVGEELSKNDEGNLIVGCTHTQARYYLPSLILQFREKFPKVRVSIVESSPSELAKMVLQEKVDLALATETLAHVDGVMTLPCYEWQHTLVVPEGHPLAELKHTDPQRISLAKIAQYPIVTYDRAFSGRTNIDAAFSQAEIKPDIILEAVDSDVIKTYASMGLGIGIVSEKAFDARRDQGLVDIPVGYLFGSNLTRVGFRRNTFIRNFLYEFLLMCSPGNEQKEFIESLKNSS